MIRRAAPALLLLAPFFAASQTGPNPAEFEVASVKPVPLGTSYGGIAAAPVPVLRARFAMRPRRCAQESPELMACSASRSSAQGGSTTSASTSSRRFNLELPCRSSSSCCRSYSQIASSRSCTRRTVSRSAYEMTIAKSGLKMRPAPLPSTPRLSSGEASAPPYLRHAVE